MQLNQSELDFMMLVIELQGGVEDLCLTAPNAILHLLQTPTILNKLKLFWDFSDLCAA